jgi:UDP:flavonoid glycosyltransferase YjiC (YdhE family)
VRVVIPLTGSRGDVQPYVALGVGLQAAGHEVCLVTHDDFGPFVRGRGLSFVPAGGDSRALHQTETGRRMLNAGRNCFLFLREFVRLRQPLYEGLTARCLEACRTADLVLLTPTAFLPALSVAEKLGLPACSVTYLPTTPSRAVPFWLFPDAPAWLPGRSSYRWASYLLGGEYAWLLARPAMNRVRRDVLGLPPLPILASPRLIRDMPTLHGYSPRVAPRPADWPEHHHVTGYWFLDGEHRRPGWRPPPGLADFLDSGPPPVVVGFGSMPDARPDETARLVVAALDRVGQRGVLLTGWGGLAEVPASDRVFVTEAAPHDWLFPCAATVVHHGGAGTTAAGLRAGVPSVLVPFAADQFFWARRVFALGVGARAVPRRRLTADRLVGALRAVLGDGSLRRRAAALGAQIRAEDGVGQAVRLLERYAVPGDHRGTARTLAAPRPAPPPEAARPVQADLLPG